MTQKEYAQRLAKALTHACYRNGYIEDIHSNPSKNLYDSDMKLLNKDIYNRVYTICLVLLATKEDNKKSQKVFDEILGFNSLFGNDWDDPEIAQELVMPETLDLIKQIENNLGKINY